MGHIAASKMRCAIAKNRFELRFDYLGCAGHAHFHTPNMDRLAAMAMRLTNSYVQSPACGASRMSTYIGRYASSHGAAWNRLSVKGRRADIGRSSAQAGCLQLTDRQTRMVVDGKGMDHLGISTDSIISARVSECGFNVYIRDDGLWTEGPDGFYDTKRSPYNKYLKSKAYGHDNPLADHTGNRVLREPRSNRTLPVSAVLYQTTLALYRA
ncbi:MAG: arylsulfatase A-like enzyme, partial [Paracoccaceae bacterium]